jgi:hypothetical protein
MILRRVKVTLFFVRLEIDQRWKHKDHVTTFVHDRTSAMRAGHFARQTMFEHLFLTLIPHQTIVSIGKVDVFFMEDCSPLEWSS